MSFSEEGGYNSLSHACIWTYEITMLIYFITLLSNIYVNQLYKLKPAPRLYFVHLILHSYYYNTYIEGLLHAILCLATLLSSEQCHQFERFQLQHVHDVNKTISFKRKLIGNNAEASRVNRNTL